jgi:hypothetical protein
MAQLIALAGSEEALYRLEIGESADEDAVLDRDDTGVVERDRPLELAPSWTHGRVLDVDASGTAIVVLVDRRPPLLVSHDGGVTWSERGAGLPRGRAVALGENPDLVLYATESRLYVSRDGGRFWRAVAIELNDLKDIAWGY